MKIYNNDEKDLKFTKEFINQYHNIILKPKTEIITQKVLYNKIPEYSTDVKILFFSGENLHNEVKISNALFRISPWFFNTFFSILPKKLLNKTILKPYKKYFKILNKKNYYFILCNYFNKKNILSMPYFMYKYEQEFKHKLLNKKVTKNMTNRKFCAFIVSNPSNIERLVFFKKLSKYKQIDSYGKIFRNMPESDWSKHTENYKIFEKYKFVICYENSYAEKYITEKLPVAMMGTVIPIYKGASDVNEYFNKKSFLNRSDFKSDEELIQKIIELDQNDEKYLKMLSEPWFKDGKEPESIKRISKKITEFLNNI
jgi:hypothetical protein